MTPHALRCLHRINLLRLLLSFPSFVKLNHHLLYKYLDPGQPLNLLDQLWCLKFL